VIELQSKQVGPGALLVLGDSIMEAMYGDRLCGLPVLNAGVGGMGIDFVAAHVDRMLSWSRPSYVLVSVGINDATRTGSPRSESDLSRWTRTYSSVLDRIEAARAVPLLMTLLPIETDGALGERYFDRATVVDLNRRLRELSEVRNRRLIDGFSAFSDHKGAMKIGSTVDGVHLTGESYRLLRSLIERGLHQAAKQAGRSITCGTDS
jgi:lysophospholipase L1-like esterase